MDDKKDNALESSDLTGGAMSVGGVALIKKQIDRGNLTGREKLYHNTHKNNVESILKNGFSGSKATDKKVAVTPDALNHLNIDDLKNKVYFGRKKHIADGVGAWAASNIAEKNVKNDPSLNRVKEHVKQRVSRKTLKANIPTWKLKEVSNPELLGAKDVNDYIAKYNNIASKGEAIKKTKKHLKRDYKSLSKKGTAVISGDISSSYIKGHKNYKGLSIEELGEFMSKNPTRFKKGLKASGVGLGLIGGGLALANLNNNEKKASYCEEIENMATK